MRFAVILSGCGVRDGSEIHESVLLMLSLCQAGHEVSIFAPDKAQTMVVNGVSGKPMSETRNVLVESARIARGAIKPLSSLVIEDVDAIALPGGFGAALNLCDFGQRGEQCRVDAEVERVLVHAHEAGKVLGFMCIAPVIAARVFGKDGVRVTIGSDVGTARACEAMGAHHEVRRYDEACVDENLKIVTTPAYMEAGSIVECYASAQALVRAMTKLLECK